jgi:hypothetical protein
MFMGHISNPSFQRRKKNGTLGDNKMVLYPFWTTMDYELFEDL